MAKGIGVTDQGWAVYEYQQCVVVVPINDLKVHSTTNMCWCRPVCDSTEQGAYGERVVLTHKALDLREWDEAARELFL